MAKQRSHHYDFNRVFEDQYILAFRLYTRGIIAYSHFIQQSEAYSSVAIDISETPKKLSRLCIKFASDALQNLLKSLAAMPSFGGLRESMKRKNEEE